MRTQEIVRGKSKLAEEMRFVSLYFLRDGEAYVTSVNQRF